MSELFDFLKKFWKKKNNTDIYSMLQTFKTSKLQKKLD